MDVLVCVKRVPDTGAKIVLTDDNQEIDTSNLGFTMSPHEECAVEEAIQIAEETGGTATALTVGAADADEQVRTAIAMQADEGVLLDNGGDEWGPRDTAATIAEYAEDGAFDLLLFGNESADQASHQVGIRVANELGLPVVAGIKSLDIEDGTAIAKREVSGGDEVYELPLPAVVTVKEGLNEPRYPSMRSKMQARRQEIGGYDVEPAGKEDLQKIKLVAPETDDSEAEILGEGPEATDEILEVLRDDVEVI